ncbi:hypothetical protein R3P38DRAFT_3245235 [Favolaschia claudopus]|uniref:Uncharacterized protein n=1 Tax=Favolaschia claudopus TaxID=2862362 RepID=A0AAV9Z0Z2_9AGAR
MDIRKSKLQIAYKLSSWKKADKTAPSSTPSNICKKLFSAARAEIIARSNKKSRKTDAIEITIVDNTPKETKETVAKTTTKKGKTTNKIATKKRKQRRSGLVDLEEARYCEKHSAHCVVASNGDHIKLSVQNLSLWSQLLFQGVHTSLSQAPKVLGLPTEAGYEAPAPSRAKLSQPQNAPPQAYPPYPTNNLLANHLPVKLSPPVCDRTETVLDDPTLYPKIDDWLLDLDTSPRGEDGSKFSAVRGGVSRARNPACHSTGRGG